MLSSLSSDQLIMSGATIFYDSIYAERVIKNAVENALREYTKTIPFDGKVRLNDVIDTLQRVTGVNDVQINHLAINSGLNISPVNRSIELPAGM